MAVVLFPSHSYTSTYPLSHSPCPASSSTFTTYPPSRKRPPPPLASSLSYRSRSPKSAKTCASIGSVSRSCATATRTTAASSTSTSSAAEEMKGLGERRSTRSRTVGIELSIGLVFPLPPSTKGPPRAVQPYTTKADKPTTYTSKSKEQKRDQVTVTVTVEEVHSDSDSSDSDLDSDSERDGEEDYYTNLRLAQRTPIRTSPLSFAPNSKYPLQLSSHSPLKPKSKSRSGGMNLYKLAIRHCMRESEEGRRILMVGAKRAVGVFQATRELEKIVQRMDEAECNLDFVNTPEFDNQCLKKARLFSLSPAAERPEAYRRLMKAIAVPNDHEFSKDRQWDRVRDKVVELLNERNIKVTSVDFVRFTWLDKELDREIEEELQEEDREDEVEVDYDAIPPIKPVEYGIRHFTNPTIWIGVLPDTLPGAAAHEAAKDIRAFLDGLQADNIDIAFRETIAKLLYGHGSTLFAPAEDSDALVDVIDNVSVALSLPIAGLKTTMQGTLGPYFRVGNKLYAISARHNVFSLDDSDNEDYRYPGIGPKKEVVVMGASMYANYLVSIQAHIGTLISSVVYLETQAQTFRGRAAAGINVEESQTKLQEYEAELTKTRSKISKVKNFFVEIKTRWGKRRDRVIGFVAWAPSLGVGAAPHHHTRDFCVIELYREKFKRMVGNVLSLGPECTPSKLKNLICDRTDVSSKFTYPDDGILPLSGMLTADELDNPDLNLQGDRIRRVIKRGCATNTTVGTLTGFTSFVRKYYPTGNMESLELPILSHENESGTFSKGGDSGSLIVSASGEFVGLLTSGTGRGTDGSDMTYATPFEWVWKLVLDEFPGASLDFADQA
ncbi:hypothetical protein EYR40_007497 [Pleurotus pulmonarius]|nr:hypothetical protein EYR40_007497 [Pleurotus pulmonarius]